MAKLTTMAKKMDTITTRAQERKAARKAQEQAMLDALAPLVGRKFTGLHFANMSVGERWPVLELEGGVTFVLVRDEEGNGPGVAMVDAPGLPMVMITGTREVL